MSADFDRLLAPQDSVDIRNLAQTSALALLSAKVPEARRKDAGRAIISLMTKIVEELPRNARE